MAGAGKRVRRGGGSIVGKRTLSNQFAQDRVDLKGESASSGKKITVKSIPSISE